MDDGMNEELEREFFVGETGFAWGTYNCLAALVRTGQFREAQTMVREVAAQERFAARAEMMPERDRLSLRGWVVHHLAMSMEAHLRALGAQNFCTWDVSFPADGELPARLLTLTAQWQNGETPAQKVARIEQELAAVKADFDSLEDAAAAVVREHAHVDGEGGWRLDEAIEELRDSGRDGWWEKTDATRVSPTVSLRRGFNAAVADRDAQMKRADALATDLSACVLSRAKVEAELDETRRALATLRAAVLDMRVLRSTCGEGERWRAHVEESVLDELRKLARGER